MVEQYLPKNLLNLFQDTRGHRYSLRIGRSVAKLRRTVAIVLKRREWASGALASTSVSISSYSLGTSVKNDDAQDPRRIRSGYNTRTNEHLVKTKLPLSSCRVSLASHELSHTLPATIPDLCVMSGRDFTISTPLGLVQSLSAVHYLC